MQARRHLTAIALHVGAKPGLLCALHIPLALVWPHCSLSVTNDKTHLAIMPLHSVLS